MGNRIAVVTAVTPLALLFSIDTKLFHPHFTTTATPINLYQPWNHLVFPLAEAFVTTPSPLSAPFLKQRTMTAAAAGAASTTTTSATTTPTVPLANLAELAKTATSYASAHGLEIEKRHRSADNKNSKSDDDSSTYFEAAPVSLLPNAFPRKCFVAAMDLAPAWNVLVDRISRRPDFLRQTLQGVVTADPYTQKLLALYQEIYGEDSNHRPEQNQFARDADRMNIHRSDYMLQTATTQDDETCLKQVELNTIASSFGSLACKVAAMHSFLVSRYQDQVQAFLDTNEKIVVHQPADAAATATSPIALGVPENTALERLAASMHVAVQHYQDRFVTSTSSSGGGRNPTKIVVLFVVTDGETNTVDQRMLEFQLWQAHAIPVVRLSLTRLAAAVNVDPDTGALTLVADGSEIALVYYRAGYAPTDYPDGYDGTEWQARRLLELSRATKAPSLGYHLAGTKKVQQQLARPGMLEQFFDLPKEQGMVDAMRAAFAGLYSLGDDATEEDLKVVRDILTNEAQGQYVLKPQREGGGYNFYGDDLKKKLSDNVVLQDDGQVKLDPKLSEYILMERLFPPQQQAILMRAGKVEGVGDSISELGCFGTIVCDKNGKVLHNEYAGFLLRTKFSNVNEGGVASGFATLSSPYLV